MTATKVPEKKRPMNVKPENAVLLCGCRHAHDDEYYPVHHTVEGYTEADLKRMQGEGKEPCVCIDCVRERGFC